MKKSTSVFTALITDSLYADEMDKIPGVTFIMGSGNGKMDEKPMQSVTLSPFYMNKCGVTQKRIRRTHGTESVAFSDSNDPIKRTRGTDCCHDYNTYGFRYVLSAK